MSDHAVKCEGCSRPIINYVLANSVQSDLSDVFHIMCPFCSYETVLSIPAPRMIGPIGSDEPTKSTTIIDTVQLDEGKWNIYLGKR